MGSGPRSRTVAFDLVSRLPFAARTSEREVIVFGWPDAEPRLGLRLRRRSPVPGPRAIPLGEAGRHPQDRHQRAARPRSDIRRRGLPGHRGPASEGHRERPSPRCAGGSDHALAPSLRLAGGRAEALERAGTPVFPVHRARPGERRIGRYPRFRRRPVQPHPGRSEGRHAGSPSRTGNPPRLRSDREGRCPLVQPARRVPDLFRFPAAERRDARVRERSPPLVGGVRSQRHAPDRFRIDGWRDTRERPDSSRRPGPAADHDPARGSAGDALHGADGTDHRHSRTHVRADPGPSHSERGAPASRRAGQGRGPVPRRTRRARNRMSS